MLSKSCLRSIASKCDTLFLDRDGVINKLIVNDYVRDWSRFEFLPGVFDALNLLQKQFSKIVVVTNQRGVSLGLMKVSDVENVHEKMRVAIKENNGRIDDVYYCPHGLDENCGCRKPDIGMLIKAKKNYPEIDFNRSIVVGDSEKDIAMGNSVGATTVGIGSAISGADFSFEDLLGFAESL